MKDNKDLKLAVLIDADNIPYSNVKGMLNEIAKFGIPTIKRIYGDWTKPTVSGWKSSLLENAITPIQQYSYTTGKNATDSAMIIDAMDILHSEKVDGFCIVSSDSDFTRLATRLRESGKLVIGIGEKKTPNPFIVSCDKFIYLEILKVGDADLPGKKDFGVDPSVQSEVAEKEVIGKDLINLFRTTIDDLADDTGWAFLAEVGGLIMKKKPDFDPRNYGFLKLTPLMKSLDKYFQIEEREVENKRIKHIYVKNI
ncbi:NYN domain-containing protein [uncultured Coprobacter sp.]|jgi:conserved domain protein|uniref:NYN domain-containing protein n=1 Tax=uncultured Coprobacter sp. TaxID=1720550 RepID=UPI0025D31A5A|nr:NYN domain-containing protein [uncultured Coprobacter sp.]